MMLAEFSFILSSSLSILCLDKSSTSTGAKDPNPTCKVTSENLIPSIQFLGASTASKRIQSNVLDPGIEFDVDWALTVQANTSAIERRCSSLPGRRSVKKNNQAAWLLKAISCIDLTTLSGDDTENRVRRLCRKAKHPVRKETLNALGIDPLSITTAAVCVYHEMVEAAVSNLIGSGIPVAAVSTGFPAGLSPFSTRLREIHESVKAGAEEIDIE